MDGERSFQEIYDRFRPGVLRFLSLLVGEEEAEDVAQEVFLRVDRALEGFRRESSVHVADGDTITVLGSNKEQHKLRIEVIDAPAKGKPFGNASRMRLGGLVARKEVRVLFQKHYRYGRIVGKVPVRRADCPTCGKTLDAGLAQITNGDGMVVQEVRP